MRKLNDFLDAYMHFTSHHEASPVIHKWTAVSILAAALERRVSLPRAYYTLFPNLYIVIVGKSGIMRKSTSTAIGVKLFGNIPEFPLLSQQASGRSLLDQIASFKRSVETPRGVIEYSPGYIYASELKLFLTEVYGSNIELMTHLYDNPKGHIYATSGKGNVELVGPVINMLAASTKEWLNDVIPESELAGGFASRIIFVMDDVTPKKWVAWPKVPEEDDKIHRALVADLHQIYKLSGEVIVPDETKSYYEDWYVRYMNAVSKSQDKRFTGYHGRFGDMVLKLSIVKSVSRSNDLTIKIEDVRWAIMSLMELEPAMKAAFSERLEDRILEMLPNKSNEAIPESMIYRYFSQEIRNTDRLVAAIKRLTLEDRVNLVVGSSNRPYYWRKDANSSS